MTNPGGLYDHVRRGVRRLLNLHATGYDQRFYSIDGEDALLASLYESRPAYKGFYLDIGAYHPLQYSNTHYFYEHGWRGINIDASPGAMKAFAKLRPHDINLELGVGHEDSVLQFYSFNEPAMNTFDAVLATHYSQLGYKLITVAQIPVLPINKILDRYLPRGQKIDFIDIDVEGKELEILNSLNWDQYAPDYLIVEELDLIDTDLSEVGRSAICKLLKAQGYRALLKAKRSVIYGKTSHAN